MFIDWERTCWFRGVGAAAILLAVGVTASTRARAQEHPAVSAQELMREVVQNELEGPDEPPTYWRYREIEKQKGVTKTLEVYETEGGTVHRLIAIDGHPLSPSQEKQERARLDGLLRRPASVHKETKARAHDESREEKLFRMMPRAFLFHYAGREGNLVRLDFQPNHQFSPPSREAQVFHHMAGSVLINPAQKRLAEIDGRLTSEVKFFWGLLGHLNKGGTFRVRRADEGGGNWKLVRLKVHMEGVALFFETIGVHEDKRYQEYHQIPDSMTLAEAIQRLAKGHRLSSRAVMAAKSERHTL